MSKTTHKPTGIRRILHENGLSLILFTLFLVFLVGQSVAGWMDYNSDRQEHGESEISFTSYLGGAHFLEATMENWESEFLQMFGFVFLTAFFYQKGSAESKKPYESEPVDRDPAKASKKKDVPWPVRKGGFALLLYENSLALAFLALFFISVYLHAVGGAALYNEEQAEHGQHSAVSTVQYMATSRFWFESFQNWQSEFLAVGAMVVLSIFLRQRGSPESKEVDAPHHQTGE